VTVLPTMLMLLLLQQDDLRQGLNALNHNDLAGARESLERAARLEPQSAVVWVGLAQTYLRSGDKERALEAVARAEQVGVRTAAVEHSLALFYIETGDLKKAAVWETRCMAASPPPTGAETVVASLGQALLKQGNFAEALGLLETAQRRFPGNAQIVLAWGVACYTQRRPEEAIGAFLRVIRLDATIEQPYVFLSRILDHAGSQLPQITADDAAWERKEPDNYLPVFLHAKALLASPNRDAAAIETMLRRSIQLNGGFWESHRELGTLLSQQGRWAEAERELSRSIELNPGEAKTHFSLARVYLHLGNPDKANAERAQYERLKSAENAAAGTP